MHHNYKLSDYPDDQFINLVREYGFVIDALTQALKTGNYYDKTILAKQDELLRSRLSFNYPYSALIERPLLTHLYLFSFFDKTTLDNTRRTNYAVSRYLSARFYGVTEKDNLINDASGKLVVRTLEALFVMYGKQL